MIRPIILFASIFILACNPSGDNGRRVPKDVLDKEVMINLMVDLYLSEAAHNLRITDRDTANPSYADLMGKTLEKHDVKKIDYEKSLQFYAEKPEEINLIYDEVLQRLSQLQSEQEYSTQE